MSLQTDIEELEKRLAELRTMAEKGYQVVERSGFEEYTLGDDHEVICDPDGSIAGIVVNQKIMKKYFSSEYFADGGATV